MKTNPFKDGFSGQCRLQTGSHALFTLRFRRDLATPPAAAQLTHYCRILRAPLALRQEKRRPRGRRSCKIQLIAAALS